MNQEYQVKYIRASGSSFLSQPFADKHSAEMIAAIGRVTGPMVGVTACEVVPVENCAAASAA